MPCMCIPRSIVAHKEEDVLILVIIVIIILVILVFIPFPVDFRTPLHTTAHHLRICPHQLWTCNKVYKYD